MFVYVYIFIYILLSLCSTPITWKYQSTRRFPRSLMLIRSKVESNYRLKRWICCWKTRPCHRPPSWSSSCGPGRVWTHAANIEFIGTNKNKRKKKRNNLCTHTSFLFVDFIGFLFYLSILLSLLCFSSPLSFSFLFLSCLVFYFLLFYFLLISQCCGLYLHFLLYVEATWGRWNYFLCLFAFSKGLIFHSRLTQHPHSASDRILLSIFSKKNKTKQNTILRSRLTCSPLWLSIETLNSFIQIWLTAHTTSL